jgi:hypothetical protein
VVYLAPETVYDHAVDAHNKREAIENLFMIAVRVSNFKFLPSVLSLDLSARRNPKILVFPHIEVCFWQNEGIKQAIFREKYKNPSHKIK